ncbi:MAG: imidazoleglycerol-phosphate dehydratase [Synergistaceae bacterium]|nr:imidazoleglycerol-phosphate dehydratase [Synergistaceae bacterium]
MKKKIIRNTNETSIELCIESPGTERNIDIGCGFLAHMIDLMFSRAGISISLKAEGDTYVDYHHLTEDIGIVLGQILRETAKGKKINRYGWCLLPMDGSLARVALDFSGRGRAFFSGTFPSEKCGDFDMELVPEFFNGLAREGGITLHVSLLETDNSHHSAEAIFKGVGMALRQALSSSEQQPSTKGLWL